IDGTTTAVLAQRFARLDLGRAVLGGAASGVEIEDAAKVSLRDVVVTSSATGILAGTDVTTAAKPTGQISATRTVVVGCSTGVEAFAGFSADQLDLKDNRVGLS